MNPDLTAFLEQLHANPFDETTRLVFADWLDEHGDAERAAILRRGNIPLWEEDQAAALALGQCRFNWGTADKQFSHDIANRAKGYVECDVCLGRGWRFLGVSKNGCVDCRATGKLDKPPDLTPRMWLWTWVELHRYRRSVKDARIRELAAARHDHCVKLLDIGWLKSKRLTKRNKTLRDMRTTLFDGEGR